MGLYDIFDDKQIKIFNNLEEIQKYYNSNTDTYEFVEDRELLNVQFNFDLVIRSSIYAKNIKAKNINSHNINAWNITAINIKAYNIMALDINANYIRAWDINACYIFACNIFAFNIYATDIKAKTISYYAICFAYKNIVCEFIKNRYLTGKHFVLDGKVIIKGEQNANTGNTL